jgi:putative DNA methylase
MNDRRLIEDFLPIQAISAEASREKSVRKGHISTLHLWWARRPLVACRAAVYGALVPASKFVPENGPDNKKQSLGRANAAKFIQRLCRYPSDSKLEQKADIERAIKEAQRHILEAHAERLTEETGKKVTVEDIEEGRAPRPKVLDMFAGGGGIPLEALRLGCEAYALDLNPVAHVIELCTLVYPQKYGKPDPNVRGMTGPMNAKGEPTWGGLANELRYWGEWVLKKVKAEIGDLYPLIPDPEYKGNRPPVQAEMWQSADKGSIPPGYLMPVAYLWTRTVRCKNPTCGAIVPLVRQTWLCKKSGGKRSDPKYVAVKICGDHGNKDIRFEVVEARSEAGLGFNPSSGSKGGDATCSLCGTVADSDYVKAEGCAKRFGHRLMAVVSTRLRSNGKVYLSPSDVPHQALDEHSLHKRVEETAAAYGITVPTEPLEPNPRSFDVQHFGFTHWRDILTPRQLLAMTCFAGQIRKAHAELVNATGDTHISTALATCLSMALGRLADYCTSFCTWQPEFVAHTFDSPGLPMIMDFAEANPVVDTSGSWPSAIGYVAAALDGFAVAGYPGTVVRGSALKSPWPEDAFDAIITDPPYYDSRSYSNLADHFFVWHKRSLGHIHSEHFASELTPKKNEAIAAKYRHKGSKESADRAYEKMMEEAFIECNRVLRPGMPLVCVYAHKTTAGWSTLINALMKAGFMVVEAWPVDMERKVRQNAQNTAALASSIFLVARKREGLLTGSYEEEVRSELDKIVRERVDSLWKMGITGADLVIAAVGAGLRAFTKFSRVEYANGEDVQAEKFLTEVEGVVLETLLEKIFGVKGSGVAAVDGPSRFYVLWRYTYKVAEMDAGEAIVFTYGQNVELDGQNGLSSGSRALVEKKKGKYRLRDFAERGDDEKLGMPKDDGKAAPLIDVLHRILWLVENDPRELNDFLDKARPDRERLRLVAQTLAGTALAGRKDNGPEHTLATTTAESAALKKLVANWRAFIEQRLTAQNKPLVKFMKNSEVKK